VGLKANTLAPYSAFGTTSGYGLFCKCCWLIQSLIARLPPSLSFKGIDHKKGLNCGLLDLFPECNSEGLTVVIGRGSLGKEIA
jgi:hypothetical protein